MLQPVKVFYMLVGIDDLHLDINREGIYTGILQPVKVFYMYVGGHWRSTFRYQEGGYIYRDPSTS
jgi:hypothetical protein